MRQSNRGPGSLYESKFIDEEANPTETGVCGGPSIQSSVYDLSLLLLTKLSPGNSIFRK